MATSSIFADFSIKDKKTVESFVDALEKSYNDSLKNPVERKVIPAADKKLIEKFLGKK